MMQKHCIFIWNEIFSSKPLYEEVGIVHSILVEFSCWRSKHSSNKFPSLEFIIESRPITSVRSAGVKERNDERAVLGWSKSNACNFSSNCLNVNSNERAGFDELGIENLHVAQRRLDPYFSLGATYLRELGLAAGLNKISNCY